MSRINELFEQTVTELMNHSAVVEPREWANLYGLCERVIYPTRSDSLEWLDAPIIVGNAALHRPTYGMRLWVVERADQWFHGEHELRIYAAAFALAHARDQKTLESITTRGLAVATVRGWARTLTATEGQLSDAVERILTPDGDKPSNDDPYSPTLAALFGDIVAKLCATYHQPPRVYLWDMPDDQVLHMLSTMPLPNGYERDTNGPKVKAFRDYRAEIERIKARSAVKADHD